MTAEQGFFCACGKPRCCQFGGGMKRPIKTQHILLALYLLGFTAVFINTAWLCDDIFITFRAVDNFLKGYGPVWNVGERVQAYTHPLWYALLVIGIGIFKHHYWFTLALSYACLLGTLYLFLKIARYGNMALAMLASVALLLSRAFADYSSSGLENPLLHLLLCAYVLVAITQADAARRFLYTGLLYSLLFLTRPDSIFLVTPTSLWMLWQAYKACGWKRTLKLTAIAAAPAVVWEEFSLIYYGSLVPNTAIAKMNLGYPRSEMLARGWNYLMHGIAVDPVTLGTILLAAPISIFLGKSHLPKLLMAGVALQLGYICWVGGDYMQGRFLTTSLLAAAIAIALSKNCLQNSNKVFAVSLAAFYGTLIIIRIVAPQTFTANIRYAADYSTQSSLSYWEANGEYGQSDQRAFYYPNLGLLTVVKKHSFNPYTHMWIQEGRQINDEIIVRGDIGMFGWGAWEYSHIIDTCALGDPFLARLPALPKGNIGHYLRPIPKVYIESLTSGKNFLTEPVLASLYDDVAMAARGLLFFSKKRWEGIWRLNTGYYNHIQLRTLGVYMAPE